MIVDCHVHLYAASDDEFQPALHRLLTCMDRMEIDRACVCLGRVLRPRPIMRELEQDNRWVAEAVQSAPDRLIGFVYCSPLYPRFSVELMNRYIAEGTFQGVKLWICRYADDPGNDLIATRAGELQAPVLQHTFFKATGNQPGESTPDHLVTLARRHPDTNFIMAHMGGDWQRGLRAVKSTPNIITDTCGGDPEAGAVELAVQLLGEDRVVFGSDATGRSFASQLAKVTGADISDTARKRILSENILRLLPGYGNG